ncbi:MAG: amidohydrolase family protein [Acidobacteriaceae bacterium]|nr:amidohydrolase family protein [Acidobacteriaceae bacterium]
MPIDRAPIRHGWVETSNGRIVDLGEGVPVGPSVDLGDVALLPGLVNAHTHIELSYLHHRVPAAEQFVDWIRGVVAMRRQHGDASEPAILMAARQAIADAARFGTALVGDISNTLLTPALLCESSMHGVVFDEIIRFNSGDAAAVVADACRAIDAVPQTPDVRVSLAAHAPYSVAPSVFREIVHAAGRRGMPISVHLSESRAESEFIREGTGPWRQFLDDVGAWNPEWTPPGTTPVAYLDSLGFLGPQSLVVHGVQMSGDDLARLCQRHATLVTSPRSNLHTGAGTPPVAAFYASGVRVAVGTDSLASTEDMNVFSELATLRRLAPGVAASRLLESATRSGADALGFEADYGTLTRGKRARILAVSLPGALTDVEEYLVGGIEPAQLHWVE